MQDDELDPFSAVPEPITEGEPDYVAVVIEWEEPNDQAFDAIAEQAADVLAEAEPAPARGTLRRTASTMRTVALGVGAIGALLVARWAIDRLRHA